MSDHKELEELERRLERLTAAVRAPPTAPPAAPSAPPAAPTTVAGGGFALAVALVAYALASGHLMLLVAAALVAGLSAVFLIRARSDRSADATAPRIGLGASIGQDAVVEPGARVEMGADIGPGAVIRRGAVVRSGASVRASAVIEADAVVSWGADVKERARVGRGATVGAGATVHANSEVPDGMRLLPGADWAHRRGAGATPGPRPEADPREARLLSICDGLAAELRQAPESVRAFLGASDQTVPSLRESCLGLIAREHALRRECSEESLSFLERERRELQSRAAAATDERVRQSLQHALLAIDDQVRQRGALRTGADRIAADLTRLEWTLDGMRAQLVRLRSAGAQAGGDPTAEVVGTVRQLSAEIEALAEAMEEVGGGLAAPVDERAVTQAPASPAPGERVR